MNELQKSMNGIKASEKLKADTLRYLEEQREVKGEGSRAENKAGNRAYVRRFSRARVCLIMRQPKTSLRKIRCWYLP